MVTVKSFVKRETKDGRSFVLLELTGSIELVQSTNTGRFYATQRRCFIPSTFDEATAAEFVGSSIDGQIVRVPVDEPYSYTTSTGEVIQLQHEYCYKPTPESAPIGSSKDPAVVA